MKVDNDIYSETRLEIQKFIKLFGVLEQNKTPCGYPLSFSQVLALQELENANLSIVELAQRLLLERSSVSRLVDSLVKEEFVRREINKSNRREVILTLTEKGKRSINNVKEQSIHFFDKILGPYNNEEHIEILSSIRKLTKSLSTIRGAANEQK